MDDDRDDFEEKMEADEIDALDEEDLLLGLDDEGEPTTEDEDEDELLDKFGFTRKDDEELSDF